MKTKLFLAIAAIAALSAVSSARADLSLNNGNAAITIATSGANAGVSSWTVDGTAQLFQQWFWFRSSSTTREWGVHNIGGAAPVVTEGSFGSFGQVVYTYSNGISVTLNFILTGGSANSGTADISEQIAIRDSQGHLAGSSLFQYVDFDLGGTPNDDTINFINGNTFQQTDGSSSFMATNSGVPTPSRVQAGFVPTILAGLNDGVATNLNGNLSAGPGNVAAAMQWDISHPTDFIVSLDKHIQIPAPGAALLGWMGLAVVGWMKRRVA